jgi:ATP-dependent DNA helicase RecG
MATRPEILFPLFSSIASLKGVGPRATINFEKIGIKKIRDILFTLPVSFVHREPVNSVINISSPRVVIVEIEVIAHHQPVSPSRPYVISVQDSSCTFKLIFFRSQEKYLESLFPVGSRKIISGKVETFDGSPQIAHPDYVVSNDFQTKDSEHHIPRYEPRYPLTHGITQKVFLRSINQSLVFLPNLIEWIDSSQITQSNWPDWKTAIKETHKPESLMSFSPDNPARERLAYDELFAHQLTLAIARLNFRKRKGFSTEGGSIIREETISKLGYDLTGAQETALKDILSDMAAPKGMNRLLQGDVGSGKTIIAFLALVTSASGGGQGVLMAPTEILARQHFDNFSKLSNEIELKIEILTSRDTGERRREKLISLSENKIQILIGTHAVFQKDIIFSKLRLVVIDEQHRFGVKQREDLINKGLLADILVMTATPIPRSLALTNYGDMEISIINEKPFGRKPIKTAIVSNNRINEVIEKLLLAVKSGNQAYWVCPLVEESDVSSKIAAEVRFKSLLKTFDNKTIGLVHGQMSSREKDDAMEAFVLGTTRVLVATTVIEVGVNVPNATIIVIERAEGFGLSQLHQLRGRVGRGDLNSNCLLVYEEPLSENGRKRLETIRNTEDGFKIAEEDLKMRGSGDLIGTAQSGLPNFMFADLENQGHLLEIAHKDAKKLIKDDPNLEGKRGRAARVLLWLMEQNKTIKLIKF